MEHKLSLTQSAAHIPYTCDNIVVCPCDSEFSMSADTLDEACGRRIDDDLSYHATACEFLESRVVFLVLPVVEYVQKLTEPGEQHGD